MNQARPIKRASTNTSAKMVCSKLPAELVGAIVAGAPGGMAGRAAAGEAAGETAGAVAAAGGVSLVTATEALAALAAGEDAAGASARAMLHAAMSGSTVEINRPRFLYSIFGCVRKA